MDLALRGLRCLIENLPGLTTRRSVFHAQAHFGIASAKLTEADSSLVLRSTDAAPRDTAIRLFVNDLGIPLLLDTEDACDPMVTVTANRLNRLHILHEIGELSKLCPASVNLTNRRRDFNTIFEHQTSACRLVYGSCHAIPPGFLPHPQRALLNRTHVPSTALMCRTKCASGSAGERRRTKKEPPSRRATSALCVLRAPQSGHLARGFRTRAVRR